MACPIAASVVRVSAHHGVPWSSNTVHSPEPPEANRPWGCSVRCRTLPRDVGRWVNNSGRPADQDQEQMTPAPSPLQRRFWASTHKLNTGALCTWSVEAPSAVLTNSSPERCRPPRLRPRPSQNRRVQHVEMPRHRLLSQRPGGHDAATGRMPALRVGIPSQVVHSALVAAKHGGRLIWDHAAKIARERRE